MYKNYINNYNFKYRYESKISNIVSNASINYKN
jgi:hypothetical protein